MPIAFAHDHVARAGHRSDHVTRLDRKNFVGVSVKEQQWFATKTGRHFATSRLRRERDHTCDLVHCYADTYRNGTTERVSHHDHTLGSGVGHQLHGSGDVEAARVEIVRSSIRHAGNRNTTLRPRITERLVQPVRRPE